MQTPPGKQTLPFSRGFRRLRWPIKFAKIASRRISLARFRSPRLASYGSPDKRVLICARTYVSNDSLASLYPASRPLPPPSSHANVSFLPSRDESLFLFFCPPLLRPFHRFTFASRSRLPLGRRTRERFAPESYFVARLGVPGARFF